MSGRSLKEAIIAILAAIMALTFAFPAVAAGPPPDTGDLYIHKFVGAAETGKSDGTVENTSSWTAIPANNVVFDLYIVGEALANTPEWPEVPPAGACSIVSGNLEVIYEGATVGVYELTLVDIIVTGDSGIDGVAIAEELARGIYLVVEDAAASRVQGVEDPSGNPLSIIAEIAPFLVAVPMTNAEGNGWIEEVHVYPKNEEMNITKAVDIDNDAIAVGDTVTYTLTATLPGDTATGDSLEIIDLLDPALTLVESSVDVTTLATPLTKETDGNGDYTVDYVNRELTISFTLDGRQKLAGRTSVTVTFDCVVNSGILGYVDYTISNTAAVEFTNEYSVSYSNTTDEEVDIHTAAIKVIKVGGNGAALTGAEFKIATSAVNAADGHFIRRDIATGELFDYDPTPGSEWENLGVANDYKGVVDATYANITTFSGLKDIEDDVYQSYFIVETKAPLGYNLLTSAREVTFTGDEDNYTLEVTVRNSAGFILPRTGGIGTIIWTVSGIILLGAAAIMFATRKKHAQGNR